MADADRGVELHPLSGLGACLHCGLEGPETLATPDERLIIGSIVFCGGCAGMHYLGEVDGRPFIHKPNAFQVQDLLKRPDVQAVRDAYQLDQMEARMTAGSRKDKRPSAPRTGGKVKLGQNRLEAKGPDAR